MKVCEHKLPIIQYFDLPPRWTQSQKPRWTNSGPILGLTVSPEQKEHIFPRSMTTHRGGKKKNKNCVYVSTVVHLKVLSTTFKQWQTKITKIIGHVSRDPNGGTSWIQVKSLKTTHPPLQSTGSYHAHLTVWNKSGRPKFIFWFRHICVPLLVSST